MDSTKQMYNQEDYELDNVYNSETDELYSSCMVEGTEKELGLFSVGQGYYFRVDAFGESGLTTGKEILYVK